MPRLDRLSSKIFGSNWAFEVYAAICTLRDSKDEFETHEVRALCSGDLKGPTLSDLLRDLYEVGLLRKLNYHGRYACIDDAFWPSMASITDAWSSTTPNPPPLGP